MLTYHHTDHNKILNKHAWMKCAVLRHDPLLTDHCIDHSDNLNHHEWINICCLMSRCNVNLSSHRSQSYPEQSCIEKYVLLDCTFQWLTFHQLDHSKILNKPACMNICWFRPWSIVDSSLHRSQL